MDYNNVVNPNSMRIGFDGRVYFGKKEKFGKTSILSPISMFSESLVDFSKMTYLEKVEGINVRVGLYDIKLKQNPWRGDISVTKFYDNLNHTQKVVVSKTKVEEILNCIKGNSKPVPIVS